MRIYLLRHAIAAPHDAAEFPDDGKRPLTEKGAERMRAAARGISSLGIRPRHIYSSPLVRCRQTAEIVASCLQPRPKIVVATDLAPGGSWKRVLEALVEEGPRQEVMVVGHEPDLSSLAAVLLNDSRSLPFLRMKKGALLRIDVEGVAAPGAGTLGGYLPPHVLRRLARSLRPLRKPE